MTNIQKIANAAQILSDRLNDGESEFIQALINYFEESSLEHPVDDFQKVYTAINGGSEKDATELNSPFNDLTVTNILLHVLYMCLEGDSTDDIASKIGELAQNLPYKSD